MCHMHVRCTCACCYYATCMSNTHVHVTTMPHECQVDVCMLLLCHMHVKYTCACCYYVTCMSNTHVHVATMPHACQVRMCMCYYATCMSNTHVHVATIPRACQIHMCILLLCYMHVKYTCAYCYYATCMSNTHVHIATMPHACQTLMCMLLLCHVHVNLPTIPYVIDPYQISFTLMLFIPAQTQCMYHRASYISTVLDFLLITFHKGNSIRLTLSFPNCLDARGKI